MKCGFGKCGRCNVGKVFVCKDGPVFSYEQILTLTGRILILSAKICAICGQKLIFPSDLADHQI